ncbi:MAG: hypothetical protein ACK56F_08290, partial [bacterium]
QQIQFHCNLVDRQIFNYKIDLEGACHKALGEEEFVDPVEFWECGINPCLEELQPVCQVFDVASKCLHRWVTPAQPKVRNSTVLYLLKRDFKF